MVKVHERGEKPNGRGQRSQQAFEFRTWGGKRKGAGRKQVNERKSQPHRERPEITSKMAVLVTLRVVENVRRMRRMDAYKALRKALLVVRARADFRVVHQSIQANHIHLVVEAEDKTALARGMQAFQASAARRLNQVDVDENGNVRKGQVFVDRYHMEVVTTPTHARHTLAYVLNNLASSQGRSRAGHAHVVAGQVLERDQLHGLGGAQRVVPAKGLRAVARKQSAELAVT